MPELPDIRIYSKESVYVQENAVVSIKIVIVVGVILDSTAMPLELIFESSKQICNALISMVLLLNRDLLESRRR